MGLNLSNKLLFCFMFFSYSCCSFALENIVHGPFKFNDGSIYIKNENDINYPLSLYMSKDGVNQKVDTYEVNGDNPNIESVFFININKTKNVIVLVSWKQMHRAEKINGRAFKIYGYSYDGFKLTINNKIIDDPNLDGVDGVYNGEELHFKYKDAASIKQYLKDNYN